MMPNEDAVYLSKRERRTKKYAGSKFTQDQGQRRKSRKQERTRRRVGRK